MSALLRTLIVLPGAAARRPGGAPDRRRTAGRGAATIKGAARAAGAGPARRHRRGGVCRGADSDTAPGVPRSAPAGGRGHGRGNGRQR